MYRFKTYKKRFQFLDIVFKDYDLKTNTYKVKGLYAKKARGYMCRFIIKNKIDCIDDLLKFNIEGYTYNNELSHGDVYNIYKKKYLIKRVSIILLINLDTLFSAF